MEGGDRNRFLRRGAVQQWEGRGRARGGEKRDGGGRCKQVCGRREGRGDLPYHTSLRGSGVHGHWLPWRLPCSLARPRHLYREPPCCRLHPFWQPLSRRHPFWHPHLPLQSPLHGRLASTLRLPLHRRPPSPAHRCSRMARPPTIPAALAAKGAGRRRCPAPPRPARRGRSPRHPPGGQHARRRRRP